MSTPDVGDPAPDFELETDTEGTIRLSDFRGKKVVVYFYPKDNTSGCTQEAKDFSEKIAEFEKADTVIIGISPDSVRKHANFRAKHDLKVILAADPERKAIEAYDVWKEKSMYGRKYMGVERSTFLIDRDGRIARVWRKVRVKGHADEVLKAAQELP
ncbi:peroxiredoxin [Thermopetrobacter sp. TC1]|uniref:peroxiredoxin n=1 Tax=Thermopetrobacter sp. TC1 TaxID=1495045 RepID=UPI0005719158|nr:peroxiredoxin [Thermopetrobacter sp. TC1]